MDESDDEQLSIISAATIELPQEETPKPRRSTRKRSSRSNTDSTNNTPILKKGRARKELSRESQDQDSEDDQENEQGAGENTSEDDESFDVRKTKTNNARSKKTPKKPDGANKQGKKDQAAKTPKGAKKKGGKRARDAESGTLFDIVMNHPNAIEAQISDWMADYTEDKVAAMVNLVNFLLESSGCPGRIEASVFEDQDSITDRLKELQEQFDVQTHNDYPIVAKGRGRGANKFRKNFSDFWSKWIARLRHGALFDEDGWCLEALVVWLVAMSSSVFRPFRHTATAVALVLLTGLCDIGKQVHNEWTTANRQLGTEQKKGTQARKTQKQQQLERRVESLHDKRVKLEAYMNDLFDSVFVHRYRDSDPVIRMECIRELGMWILKFPDSYLDPQYLRYLGWMLSDKSSTVRLEALRSLSRLYSVESMATGLRAFTERFRPRMLEMAIREKDTAVRTEAVTTVTLVGTAGLLEDVDRDSVMPLIFDADAKVRGLVSKLAEEVWKEEYLDPKSDELKAARSGSGMTDVPDKRTEIKALCEMLVRYAQMQEAQEQKRQEERQAGAIIATQTQTQTYTQTQTQSQALNSLHPPDSMGMDLGEGFEDDDLTQEEIEDRKRALRERLQVIEWLAKDDRAGDTTIGFGKVAAAVTALWDHIEVLKDWQAMCDYLSADMATSNMDLEDESESLDGTPISDANPMKLTDQEETCLVYVVQAVVGRLLSEPDTSDHGKRKLPNIEQIQSDVTRGLIKYLPRLMRKYSGEYTGAGQPRIVEIVMLIRQMDIGVYLEMRMLKAYDALFDDLKKLFLKHSNREVLAECAQTFRYLMGGPQKLEATKQLSDKHSATGGYDMQTTSTASLHMATAQKVGELVEEVITAQVAVKLKELEEAVKDSNAVEIDTLYGIRNALRRLGELRKVVDLGGMDADIKAGDDPEWNGLFELLNGVLNQSLTIVTTQKESPEEGNDSAQMKDISTVLDEIIEAVLHIMCLDVAWELRKAFTTTVQASNADKDVSDVDNGDLETGTDAQNPAIPVRLAREEAEDLLRSFNDKFNRLIPIVEAIVAGNEQEWIDFHVGVKLVAFRILAYLYLMVNGDAAITFPDIAKLPPEDVQVGSVDVLIRVVEVLSGEIISMTPNNTPDGEVIPALIGDEGEEACYEILKLIADFGRLVTSGLYDRRHTVMLLKYVGINNEERINQGATAGLFGTIWDGVAEECVKHVFGICVKDAAEEVVNEESDEKMQTRLKKFRETVRAAADVGFEGLVQSTGLYLRSLVATMDPALGLAKVIIGMLKAWVPLVKSSDELRITHGIVVETLLDLLRRGGDEMVERVEEWAVIHGDRENDDLMVSGSRNTRGTLNEVNEAWRVWGAIGGAVQQIVHELGMLKRPDGDDAMNNVEDVVEYISQQLLAKGFKPGEADKEWAGYWSFVKALEKGDSTVRKRGPRKAKPLASREGTPELTAKRKRGRPAKARPQDLDEHSEGNAKRKRAKQRHSKKVADEEEADIVTSPSLQPSRRSSRVATSAKKVYKEIDEVEDDAEESDVVVEEDTPLTKSFAKASTTVHATPSATYKRRKSRTPLIGQDTGSQNDSETQDEETTPKATYSSARNVKGRTGDVERNFEEFDDLQSTKHAEPCGTKRGRAGARSPAVTRNVAMASRTGSRSPDRGITPEPTLSEDDFVSSPEIVSRKRVRVG